MATKKSMLWIVIVLLIGVVVIADRALWASVASWREDQSTNLWLGYTQSLSDMPVGLISSQGFPNPNGMVLLGFFLSRLPNLWFIGGFLGCLQGALILWLCNGLFPYTKSKFIFIALPLLTSIPMRAVSVEFWNQWVMMLPNILFFIWFNNYLANPKSWKLPFWIILLCVSPALYLAGIANFIVMGILGLLAILLRSPMDWRSNWWKSGLASLLIIVVSLFLTWLPFILAISPANVLNLKYGEPISFFEKMRYALESILNFPAYTIFHWAEIKSINMFQYNDEIISYPAQVFILIASWAHFLVAIVAFGFLLFGLLSYRSSKIDNLSLELIINKNIAHPILFSFAFISLCYATSVLLGGPIWVRDQRPEQIIQFLPFFLLFCFLSPFLFRFSPRVENFRLWMVGSLGLVYVLANFVGGLLIIEAHQRYLGKVLPLADLPLNQKMKAVDFIVEDWKKISESDQIPVDYQLGGGIWNFVPEFGQKLETWYPAAMTWGRSFDYDLLRRYGLRNAQEGVQIREFGSGRYLINYSFEPPPVIAGQFPVHYFTIGRLRVTIVDR